MGRQGSRWIVAALAGMAVAGCTSQVLSSSNPTSKEVLTEVWSYIKSEYVDGTFNGQDWWKVRQTFLGKPADNAEQVYQLTGEMLKTLGDPYTRFLDPKQFKSLQTTTTGELTGVGLQITVDTKSELPIVIAAVEGSPASRGGIRARDLIVAIDGEPTKGMKIDDVADHLRGQIGTKVTVKLQREAQTFEVNLTRATIEVNPVSFGRKPLNGQSVGYIRLSQFNANAASEVHRALEKLEAEGVTGYILDLRSNPGGLLQAAVEIARDFLPSGQVIVYTVNRQGQRDEARTERGPLTAKPLVVLIDGGTASASEILAGALQDNHRARLVGAKSFGKGLIQAIHPLKDGSGLAVSIARYQTPARRDIHKKGIQPDIKVPTPQDLTLEELTTTADTQYAAALKALGQTVASRS